MSKEELAWSRMAPPVMGDKDVAEMFQVSRQTIWRWVKESDFPKPFSLGVRRTVWSTHELFDYIETKKGERV